MQELDARAKSLLAALKADSRSGATQLAMNTLDQLLSYLDEVEPEGETFLRLLAELRAARPSMIVIGNACLPKKLSQTPYFHPVDGNC